MTKPCVCVGQGVDTLLSDTGLRQGEAVGRYLSDIAFNRVFVSNLKRAVQVGLTPVGPTVSIWMASAVAQHVVHADLIEY